MNRDIQYTYSDLKDKIRDTFIGINESYEGYWEESENYVLDKMKKHINENLPNESKSLLDAGCGEGRLTVYFSEHFTHILAIDPDEHRLNNARKTIEGLGILDKVDFDATPIEELEENEKFDVILCSYVMQHVHTSLVPKIIKKFTNLLKSPGLLFITSCHSTKREDYFAKNFLQDSKLIEETIDQDSFNSLVFEENEFPIHFFSRENIEELLKSFDFKIIDYKVFHILENDIEGKYIFNKDEKDLRGIIVNKSPELQDKYGRDFFIAAKF